MSSLIEAGLVLTGIGMGVVFVLLGLLVGIIRAMSVLCFALEGGRPQSPVAGSRMKVEDDTELASVIGAAVAMYRRHRVS
jgi:sodium pump decarboxylase gamma subunit